MANSYDERHWYGTGWKHLCRETMILAASLVPDLADDMRRDDRSPVDAARSFLDRLIAEIGKMVHRGIDAQMDVPAASFNLNVSSSRWSYVLPLFGDTADLCQSIARDAAVITGRPNRGVEPKAAVCKLLLQHMNTARRVLSGDSPNRLKTWEVIQRASNEVSRLNPGTVIGSWGTDPHLTAVKSLIEATYPGNKNYNKSLGTLKEYFDQYGVERFQHIELSEAEESGAEELMILSEETGLTPQVKPCLDGLRETSVDQWETVQIKLEFDDMEPESQRHYQARKGISKHEFGKRYSDALAFLLNCLKNTVAYKLMGGR
jgi:hypothetical protein